MSLMDVKDIVHLLTGHAETICRKILPGGVKAGPHWQCGSLAGEKGQSLKVMLRGRQPGNWRDFSAGEGGDILDLIARALYAGDKRMALTWAKDFLGLDKADPDELRAAQQRIEVERKRAAEADQRDAEKKRSYCWQVWGVEGVKDLAGTPVEAYLAGRGIDLAACPSTGSLRWHRDLPHGPSRQRLNAMVAAVVTPEGKFSGIHRTYLELRGGRWLKAFPQNQRLAKMGLGRWGGGYVSISKGASGKSLAEAPEGDHAILTEGIEDALCLAIEVPEARVLACLSLGNIGKIRLPPQIGRVTIFGDNDEGDGERAQLARAAQEQADRHKDVRIARPPAGFKDANDYLRGIKATG